MDSTPTVITTVQLANTGSSTDINNPTIVQHSFSSITTTVPRPLRVAVWGGANYILVRTVDLGFN